MEHPSPAEINPVKIDNPFTRKPLYGKLSIVLLGLMVVSLLPHYTKIYSSSVPVLFILHGALYLGWYILFVVQTHLSASGNVATHKKLGFLSLFLFAVLTASGVTMLIGAMQAYDSNWEPWFLHARTNLIWGIFHTIFSFSTFYILGILFRKQLHIHKRFMLLAALSMVSASVTRVAYFPFIPIDGTLLTLLSTYAFLLAPIIIDRITFKRIHPVFKWCIPIYIVSQIICIGILPTTPIGRALAFPF
jgi:hypothetical protein